jgi:glyceraldehyde-3-phosphate dehydrogenase (NADP+)
VLSPICLRDAEGGLRQVELGSCPQGGEAEAEAALEAAVRAYDNGRGVWPTMSVAERIACMQDFAKQMQARRQEIVRLIMWEIGKSLGDSEKEFDRTVEYIRATIEALKDLDNSNSRFLVVEGTIGQIRRTPLGVVLCMGPYNYPLNETFATLILALIMGNTMVFKPPRYGVLLFYPLLEAFRSAFPKGVLNTVYGQGSVVVPLLLGSGKVNALTLIGSSKVADHLKKLPPKAHRLRAILGLDAKNAAILLPDADLELAVKECLLGCAWRREGCPARAGTPSSLWVTRLASLRAGVTRLSSTSGRSPSAPDCARKALPVGQGVVGERSAALGSRPSRDVG